MLEIYLTLYLKVSSKWVKDLNIKGKSMNSIGKKKVGRDFCNLEAEQKSFFKTSKKCNLR